jgi:sigma-B regulation protein RsbU (phosphoserine phosphatase)
MEQIMDTAVVPLIRDQLVDRRNKLVEALTFAEGNFELNRLLSEVDAALSRMDIGTYGLCEICLEPVETERLIADPLVRFCLGDLTPSQTRALEEDLELAARIQQGLLPCKDFSSGLWEISYHYEPAGIVSGDYLDVITGPDGDLFFALGDVSGKGVAASMLMSHLNAMFRALVPLGLPLHELVERASRIFCESTLPTQYATLVCGRADKEGKIEICNAGHLPPIWLRKDGAIAIESTGLPVGVFCDEHFTASVANLEPDDTLLLYTDGLSESRDDNGNEYGRERLIAVAGGVCPAIPSSIIYSCLEDLTSFRGKRTAQDDLTVMAIQHRNGFARSLV